MTELKLAPCIICVQYCGVFSTVGDIMMHVGDILNTVEDVQYHGGYRDKCGGIFSTVGDIMSNMGDYLEYSGGYSVP